MESDLCQYNQAKYQTKIRICETIKLMEAKTKNHLNSKTYNLQTNYLCNPVNCWSFSFLTICRLVYSSLCFSHWSDFCPDCQLCRYAASSLVCAAWCFVCSSGTNLSHGRAFLKGASPLANEFLRDSSVLTQHQYLHCINLRKSVKLASG